MSYSPNGAFEALADGESALDPFGYTLSDGFLTDTGTVTATINGQNDNPIAADDVFSTTQDAVINGDVVTADNGNGIDTDTDTSDIPNLFVSAVNGSEPTGVPFATGKGALVTINADGSLTYDPNGQFQSLGFGESDLDVFTYILSDPLGLTDTGTISVTINGDNDAPLAVNDAYSTDEDTELVVAASGVLGASGGGQDSDPDNGPLAVSEVEGSAGNVGVQFPLPSGALLTLDADGGFTYDPRGAFDFLSLDETQNDTFTYTIVDNGGLTDTATVTITVVGRKDAPVAIDDVFSTDQDTLLGGENVLAANPTTADSDPENDALSVAEINGNAGDVGQPVALASGAILQVNSDGSLSYDPDGNFDSLALNESALDGFEYTLTDLMLTDTALVSVTITGLNDDPVARDDLVNTDEDSDETGDLFMDNGFGADSDVDNGDSFTVSEVEGSGANVDNTIDLNGGLGGTVLVAANGAFTFSPAGDFENLAQGQTDTVSFTYQLQDLLGAASNTATVTATITGVNDAPVAADDDLSTNEDTVLAGENVLSDNGNGADSDVDDGAQLTVSEVNGSPASVGQPVALAKGTVTVASDGSLTFDPAGEFEDLDTGESEIVTFAYTLSDGTLTDLATVSLTVTGVNDAPVAQNDDFATDEDTVLNGGVDVLADNGNGADSDVDDAVLTVTEVDGNGASVGMSVATSGGGLVLVNADGTFSYDPNDAFEFLNAGDTDLDTFSYTISDDGGLTSTATVSITIAGVNDAPVAAADQFQTDEDTALEGEDLTADNGSGVDADVDDANLTVSEINGAPFVPGTPFALPGRGAQLTVTSAGILSYDPSGQFEDLSRTESELDVFDYTLSDGVLTNTATVSINVTGVNDAPVADDDTDQVLEDDPATDVTATLLAGDTDVDNGDDALLDITAVDTTGTTGTVTLIPGQGQGGSMVTYDPAGQFNHLAAGESALDVFGYTLSDGLLTDTALVSITINGENDTPEPDDDNISVNEDDGETDVTATLLAGDSDPDTSDNANLLISAVDITGTVGLVMLSNGAVSYNPNGMFEFLADGESVQDIFGYTLSDGVLTATAIVTATINGENDPPIANDDEISTAEDAVLNAQLVTDDNGHGVDTDTDTTDIPNLFVSAVNGSGPVGSAVVTGKGALVTVAADGSLTYDPNGQFNSLAFGDTDIDVFTYTLSDPLGLTDTAMVSVTVTGDNDPPVARDDTYSTDEDTELNVAANGVIGGGGGGLDDDPDGGALVVSEVNGSAGDVGNQITLPSGALLTLDANGGFSYDPNGAFDDLSLDASRNDTFTYTIVDEGGLTDTATVTITVIGRKDAPVAVDDIFSTDQDTVLSGENVLDANPTTPDSDPESDPLTVSAINGVPGDLGQSIALASGAALKVDSDGSLSYDPDGNFDHLPMGITALDGFDYTITDGMLSDSATVSITVTGLNDAPGAAGDAFITDEDTDALGDLFANNGSGADSDVDDADTFTVSEVEGSGANVGAVIDLNGGAGGTVEVAANGAVTYSPAGDFENLAAGESATVTFTYAIEDVLLALSNTATVTITINGVNDGPVAQDDQLATDEDTPLAGENVMSDNGFGVDSDPDDGAQLTVAEVNGSAADVGQAVVLAEGTVTVASDGSLTFDPSGDFEDLDTGESETVTFLYTLSDGILTDTATVSVTVNGVNDAPIARSDLVTTDEDTVLVGQDVLVDNGNGADSDVDVEVLTVAEVDGSPGNVGIVITTARGARVLVNADGTFSYDPNGVFESLNVGQTDLDGFSYTLTDGDLTNTALVSVTITGVNDAPIAQDDIVATNEDTMLAGQDVTADNGFGADSDVDSANLTVTEVNGAPFVADTPFALPSGAELTLNVNGPFSYNPNGQFEMLSRTESTIDSFDYTLSDGVLTDIALVSINISGVNDAPVADDDTDQVLEDDPETDITATLLAGDTDVDNGDAALLEIIALDTTGTQGTVVLSNGAVSYNPAGQFNSLAAGESALDIFGYELSDGLLTDTAIVSITINGQNDAPSADDDGIAVNEDDGETDVTSTLLDGDSDPDTSDILSISGVDVTGTVGTVVFSNGAVSYSPAGQFEALAEGESDTDQFGYILSDGALTDTAIVTATINGQNDAPIASDDEVSTTEDDVLNGQVITADNGNGVDTDTDTSDIPGLFVSAVNGSEAPGSVVVTAGGANVTVAADGTYTYDPNGQYESLAAGDSALDTFTYTLSDGSLTDVAIVSVTINGVNDAPIARDDLDATDEDTVSTGRNVLGDNGFGADSDPDAGDVLTVTDVDGLGTGTVTIASGATVTIAGNGDYTYDPNGSFEGLDDGESDLDTWTYIVSDSVLTDSAVVSVTINGVNDAPMAQDDSLSTTESTVFTTGNVKNDNGNGADTDPDTNDTLTVTEVNGNGASVGNTITLASGALLQVNADGSLSYDPNGSFGNLGAGASDTDVFTYTISDGDLTDVATVTMTITGENGPPVAQDDEVSTDEDTVLTGENVLNDNGNGADSDPDDGDQLTVVGVTGSVGTIGLEFSLTSGALLTLDADGVFSYNPNGKFETLAKNTTGSDTFSYTVSDGSLTDVAVVSITIAGRNDAPTVDNGIPDQTAPEDDLFSFPIPADAFADVDAGDSLTFSAALSPANGGLPGWIGFSTVTNTFTGTPDNGDVGTFDVEVTATDSCNESVSTTFEIEVTNQNDAPQSNGANGGIATPDAIFLADVLEETADPMPNKSVNDLIVTDNDLYTDEDLDPFGGVGIVGDASVPSEGLWQYDDGGGWMNISENGALSTTNALVLDTNDELRFKPVSNNTTNFNGFVGVLTFLLYDGTTAFAAGSKHDISGSIGGQGAFSDDTNHTITLGVEVLNSNDAPVIGEIRGITPPVDPDNPPTILYPVIFPGVPSGLPDTEDMTFLVTDDDPSALTVTIDGNTPSVNLNSAEVSQVSGSTYKLVVTATAGTEMMVGEVTVLAADNDPTLPGPQMTSKTFKFDIMQQPLFGVVRTLPDVYVPGVTFGVSVDSDPPDNTSFHGVFDFLPDEWTGFNINEDGQFESDADDMTDGNQGRVAWGVFKDDTTRTLTYLVTPPSNAADDPAIFDGVGLIQRTFFDFFGHFLIALRTIENYATWQGRVFGDLTNNIADDENFSNDPFSNLEIYGFGLNPVQDNTANGPMQEVTTTNITLPSDPSTEVEHTRLTYFRNESADPTEVEYVVEEATVANPQDGDFSVVSDPIHLFKSVDTSLGTGAWKVEALVPTEPGLTLRLKVQDPTPAPPP